VTSTSTWPRMGLVSPSAIPIPLRMGTLAREEVGELSRSRWVFGEKAAFYGLLCRF
jgi:hypothetical protein